MNEPHRSPARLTWPGFWNPTGTNHQALQNAIGWVDALAGVQDLVSAGVLGEPRRVMVETAESHAQGLDLLGAAEIAARLGVSTARVRQLEQRPDFPTPVLELAGGKIYRAVDVDAFSQAWDRTPGRPRKTPPAA